MNIKITDKAAEIVKDTFSQVETEDPHLYFYVSGGDVLDFNMVLQFLKANQKLMM